MIMAKSDRGFASMDEDKQRDIARKGGQSSSMSSEEAAKRGRKGGKSSNSGGRKSGQ